MNGQLMILSWCPGVGHPCDPCKPKPPPTVGNVTVVGRRGGDGPYSGFYLAGGKYYGSVGVEWSLWDTPLWTSVTVSVTITVTGFSLIGAKVQGSTLISRTLLFSGAGTGFMIPLPPTNLGITVVENPQPIVTTLASGAGGPSAGPQDVAVVFPDSAWPI